jgi:phage tail-like protein
MSLNTLELMGLTVRFHVVVDQIDLGGWAKCTGLNVEFKNTTVKEGGNYGYESILPDQIVYKPITLVRAMTGAGSAKVQAWLRERAASWMGSSGPVARSFTGDGGSTAQITLLDSKGGPVATWSLRNVFPAKWDGPELDAMTADVARETLQLVHEGFL